MKQLLTEYGVDWALTMERFVYDEALYLECLGMLAEDENLALLQTALASGDLTAAFEAAHTLKGVSANMGLTPLTEAVSRLVEPLRRKESKDYTEDLSLLLSAFEDVLNLYTNLQKEA